MQGIFIGKILDMSLIGCYSILIVLAARLLLIRSGRKYAYYLWLIVFLNLLIPLSIPGIFSLIPKQVASFSVQEELAFALFSEGESTQPVGSTGGQSFPLDGSNADSGTNMQNVSTGEIMPAGGALPMGELPADNTDIGDKEPSSTNGMTAPAAGGEAGRSDLESLDSMVINDENVQVPANEKVSSLQIKNFFAIMEEIWLLGILLIALFNLLRIRKFRRQLEDVSEFDEKRGIAVIEGLSAPFLYGLFHPIIYLPAGLEREEKRYIVAHELCHKRRKDYILKIVVYMITTLHWFNPLVWLAYGLFCRDMEISCDEEVLSRNSANVKKPYAESLLKYAARQNGYVMTPLTFGEPSVKTRIRNVLRFKKKSVAVSVIALLCAAGVTIGLAFRPITSNAEGGDAGRDSQGLTEENDNPQDPGAGTAVTNDNGDTAAEDEVPLTVGETFRAVLLNERPFFYLFCYEPYEYRDVMQESYVCLNEAIFNDAPLITPRFAVVDMDGDQVPEIVLEIDNYMGYIILRYKDGEIYGNEIGYRSLEDLKVDGTHGGDAGAGNNWIEKLYFIGDSIVQDGKAHKEEDVWYTSYTINDIPVEENVWNGIKTSYDETSEVEWHEFTEEAVREWVTENTLFTDISVEGSRISERQRYLDSLYYLVELTYDSGLKHREDMEQYYADAESYYNGCREEMDKIYRLCAEQLDMVEAGQQRWEEYMEQSMEKAMNANSYYGITDPKEKAAFIYFEYGDMVLRRTLRLINYYYRFYFYDVKFGLPTLFEQEEVAVVPEIQEYSFEDAVQIGEVQKLVGNLPGLGLGTWYTVTVDGVEYYYANYDSRPEEYTLFGWSIVRDSHELANGLKVGMKEEDVLKLYPNMITSVIDFEDNYIYYDEITSFMGWNGIAYPRSDAGRDSDWDYEGKEYYHWTDQFDYIMIADINLNDVDTLPIYLGLLIKDHVVAAITFYYPTAG